VRDESTVFVRSVATGGIAYSNDLSLIELQSMVGSAAIREAALDHEDIDAVFVSQSHGIAPGERPANDLADYLGLSPAHTESAVADGITPLAQCGTAVLGIQAGRFRRALVVYGSLQRTRRTRDPAGLRSTQIETRALEQESHLPRPIGMAALAASRYQHEFGLTDDALAAVAASARRWASENPEALLREPLRPSDAASSAMVCAPLRRRDICLISDGAGAIVIDGEEPETGIAIRGYGEVHSHNSAFSTGSLVRTAAGAAVGKALDEAGLRLADIDLVQVYDAFTIMPIILLEDLGFAGKGEGAHLFTDGDTAPGGRLPVNTAGGGLAHCHPGSYGIFLLIEAFRQLAGTALGLNVDARRALCHASGGGAFGGSQASIILSRSS
jgi:acetyl-CoA acetyltransferase